MNIIQPIKNLVFSEEAKTIGTSVALAALAQIREFGPPGRFLLSVSAICGLVNAVRSFCKKAPEKVPRKRPAPIMTGFASSKKIANPISEDVVVLSTPRPAIPPAMLYHGINTCFLASIMWASFLNEPSILQEIPLAIARHQDPRKRAALRRLEDFIERAQSSSAVDAKEMEKLREILHLCNSRWSAKGTDQEDASEVYATLMDLIYEGSSSLTNLHSLNILQPNGYKLQAGMGRDPVLGIVQGPTAEVIGGALALPFNRTKKTLREHVDEAFFPTSLIDARYSVEGEREKKEFKVQRKFFLDSPPPFFALTLGRFNDPTTKIEDPIQVNECEIFEPRYFNDMHGRAIYELSSVVLHSGTLELGHYTALVKRGSDWYFCDDMTGIKPIDKSDALNLAKLGYMFFYRQIA